MQKTAPVVFRCLLRTRARLTSAHQQRLRPREPQELRAGKKVLAELPAELPRSLRVLIIGSNSLQALPASLSDTLETLDVGENFLSSLPSQLPSELRQMEIRYVLLARSAAYHWCAGLRRR